MIMNSNVRDALRALGHQRRVTLGNVWADLAERAHRAGDTQLAEVYRALLGEALAVDEARASEVRDLVRLDPDTQNAWMSETSDDDATRYPDGTIDPGDDEAL